MYELPIHIRQAKFGIMKQKVQLLQKAGDTAYYGSQNKVAKKFK